MLVYSDVTERKQREQHQEYLLKLADALRPLSDPVEIQLTACQILGEYTGVNRVLYGDVIDEQQVVISRNYVNGVSPILGTLNAEVFGQATIAAYKQAENVIFSDMTTDPRFSEEERRNYAAIDVVANASMGLIKDGRWVAAFGMHQATAHEWTPLEIALLEETAERTWAAVERARAEEAFRESEERLQLSLKGAHIFTWEVNPQTGETKFSDNVNKVLGFDVSIIATENYLNIHPDDKTVVLAALDKALTGKAPLNVEHRIVNPQTGDVCWVKAEGRLVNRTAEAAPVFIGITQNITTRKLAEEALIQLEKRTRLALEGLAGGELEQENAQARDAGRAERESIRIRKGGERFWVDEIMTAIHNEQGQLMGFTKISRDITGRKRMEESLRQADQRKDEFLAMLAHELRNPMATIRSGLQILSLTAGVEEMIDSAVAMMNRQTDHLVRLVDDLLDVSRISRGKIDLRKERVNLVELVSQAAESIRPLYQERGRSLHVTLPTSPIYLEGDATRLSQVVTNLLTNGVRYTGYRGEVWLTLEDGPTLGGPTGEPEAILQVRDNGIGLAADQLSAIFELFVQVDNSLARSQGGLGLGLTLVKRLVEMHGGRVEATSEGIGKGSTFRVHLPILAMISKSSSQSAGRTAEQPTRHRILVIDDNPDAAMTLGMLLKLKGYEVHTRNGGRAGLEAAEALSPTAILLDIGMPDLDGYATCRLLREQSWGQDVVVIALSGYGQEEDKQRTQEAGFDGHLVKPVDMGVLIELLTRLLDTNRPNLTSD